MLERHEIERLAQSAHALRPDWPVRSLCTWLAADHIQRPYLDVAVALAWVAADPTTKTPKRMNEMGPWWSAVRAGTGRSSDPLHFARCPEDGHSSYRADNCGACRAEAIEQQGEPPPKRTAAPMPDEIRQALHNLTRRTP